MLARIPRTIEFAAELGADRAFLDDGQLHRQPARAQRDGELVGGLDGEAAAADARLAAEDRLPDLRRRDDDIVEDDRERAADILLGGAGEAAASGLVEGEDHVGRSVGLVEVLARVGDHVAGDDRPPFDADRRPPALPILHRQDLAADRCAPRLELLGRDVGADHLELEPRGPPDQLLERLGVLLARRLDEDPVAALAQDGGLERAERVDAPVDHVARDVHRLVDRPVEPALRRPHQDQIALVADLPVLLAAERRRLGLLAGDVERLLELDRIADREAQPALGGGDLGDLDSGPAKLAPQRVFEALHPLPRDVVGLAFEQQLAAAGKVEAEIDLDVLRPARELLVDVGRKEARHGKQHAERAGKGDAPHLPAREIQHGPFGPSRSRAWRRAGARRSAST